MVAAGVGTGLAGSALLVVWLRTTPPFSWVWPHIEALSNATGFTEILFKAERAIHGLLAEVKATWRIVKGMVRL